MGKPADPTQTREHRWTQDRLSEYLDAAVSATDRSAIERHLAQCRRCTADLDDLRRTVTLVRVLPTLPAPRAFTLHPSQAIPSQRSLRLLPYVRLGTAVAGVLLVLMVFVDVWSSVGSLGPIGMGAMRDASAPADNSLQKSAPAPVLVATSLPPIATATLVSATVSTTPSDALRSQAAGEAASINDMAVAQEAPSREILPRASQTEQDDGAFLYEAPAPPAAAPAAPAPALKPPESPAPLLRAERDTSVSPTFGVAATSEPLALAAATTPAVTAVPQPAPSPSESPASAPAVASGVTAATTLPPPAPAEVAAIAAEPRNGARTPLSVSRAAWQITQLALSAIFLVCLVIWLAVDRPLRRK